MEAALENLFKDIKGNLTTIVSPCRITRDSATYFEVWAAKGSTSIFFSSLSLFPDRLLVKFSSRLPNESLELLDQLSGNNASEVSIPASEANALVGYNLRQVIYSLHCLYLRSGYI